MVSSLFPSLWPKQVTRSSPELAWQGSTQGHGSRERWNLGSFNQCTTHNLGIFFLRIYVAKTVTSKFSIVWKSHFFGSSCPGPAWSREGHGSCENWLQLSRIVFRPLSELLHLQLLNPPRKEKFRHWRMVPSSLKESRALTAHPKCGLFLGKNQKSTFQSSWYSDRKEFSKVLHPADLRYF